MFEDAKYTEDIQTLVDIGLTYRQSKIFLALSLLGKANISALSATAKMDRANVYRAMKQLRELKIVQVSITNPTTFEALPLNDAVQLLLEGKKNKYMNAALKAKKFLKKHRQNCIKSENSIESQFILIPGGKLTLNKLEELSNSITETHDGVLCLKDLQNRSDFFYSLFKKLLCKNVKIRIIVSCKKNEKLPKIFESLLNINFKIRITEKEPYDTFGIWDKKRVFLTVSSKISEPMTDGLFVDNFAVVGLIQEYFELKWVYSKPILI